MLCQQGVNGKQCVSCRVVVLDHAAYNGLDSTKTCMAASVWTCPCHKPSFLFLIARSPDPGLSHAWQLWGLHLPAASNKDTKSHTESASMLVMQDMDVETLMQEIKQWGPQDQGQAPQVQAQAPQVQAQAPQVQAQAPQEGAIMNAPPLCKWTLLTTARLRWRKRRRHLLLVTRQACKVVNFGRSSVT